MTILSWPCTLLWVYFWRRWLLLLQADDSSQEVVLSIKVTFWNDSVTRHWGGGEVLNKELHLQCHVSPYCQSFAKGNVCDSPGFPVASLLITILLIMKRSCIHVTAVPSNRERACFSSLSCPRMSQTAGQGELGWMICNNRLIYIKCPDILDRWGISNWDTHALTTLSRMLNASKIHCPFEVYWPQLQENESTFIYWVLPLRRSVNRSCPDCALVLSVCCFTFVIHAEAVMEEWAAGLDLKDATDFS